MKLVNKLLDSGREAVRGQVRLVAGWLNQLSHGIISPNFVTILGLAGHIPIGILIAGGHLGWAAGLLVFFGLFDTLDGELARLQKRTSSAGMLLDASTDRMKEVVIYTAIAYYFATADQSTAAAWATLALGASVCVSYVKAKGETAVATSRLSATTVNKLFQDGLLRFELRMLLLVIGLLSNQLLFVTIVIALLSTYTALERLIKISRALQ